MILLLLLPGKGPGSYLNVIGPAGLVMTGKNSRVPKLLVKTVTYIRVTGHFIFQPYRYVVACVT